MEKLAKCLIKVRSKLGGLLGDPHSSLWCKRKSCMVEHHALVLFQQCTKYGRRISWVTWHLYLEVQWKSTLPTDTSNNLITWHQTLIMTWTTRTSHWVYIVTRLPLWQALMTTTVGIYWERYWLPFIINIFKVMHIKA